MIKTLPITVIIAVKNEASNIRKCLDALTPAQKIYILDSGSCDGTVSIAEQYGVETIQFKYDGGYPKKRQWALNHLPITTEWIFFIDADEVVPPKLWQEISSRLEMSEDNCIDAFMITKGFHFMGKKFRFGGFSHCAVVLFRKGRARFENIIDDPAGFIDMEVHERLIVDGRIANLHVSLIHEDFKGLTAYIERHNQYSTWEARVRYNYLKEGIYGKQTIQPKLFGNAQEQRRFFKKIVLKIPFEQLVWFFFHYIWKLGFLEGKRGLIAAQIRSAYISQVRAKIYELELNDSQQQSKKEHPVFTKDIATYPV